MAANVSKPSTWQAKAKKIITTIEGQPELHSEAPSQRQKQTEEKKKIRGKKNETSITKTLNTDIKSWEPL